MHDAGQKSEFCFLFSILCLLFSIFCVNLCNLVVNNFRNDYNLQQPVELCGGRDLNTRTPARQGPKPCAFSQLSNPRAN